MKFGDKQSRYGNQKRNKKQQPKIIMKKTTRTDV